MGLREKAEECRLWFVGQLEEKQRQLDERRFQLKAQQAKLEAEQAEIRAQRPRLELQAPDEFTCPLCFYGQGKDSRLESVGHPLGAADTSSDLFKCPECEHRTSIERG